MVETVPGKTLLAGSQVTKLICSGLENAGTIMYDLTTKSLSFRDGSIPPLKGASNFKSFKYQNSLVFLQESIVEQVPNSRNFITARTCSGKCSVEVVDAALEKQVLYFEKTLGAIDDVATSTSRGMMAFNSIKDEVSYHLVNAGDLNILRRVKWNLQHAAHIQSLDFSPDGSRIVTFDRISNCLVSEVDSSKTVFTKQYKGNGLPWSKNKSRWNPVAENCKIALKYSQNKLTMLDVIKQQSTNKTPMILDQSSNFTYGQVDDVNADCHGIDWNKDGNLLACGGESKQIFIYDLRKGEIVKKISGIHTGPILSVRWSPCGEMLATSSSDRTFKLIRFSSESVVYQSDVLGRDCPTSICFLQN